MAHSIEKMGRPVRRRLRRIAQRHGDGDYRRRANALLLCYQGWTLSGIARQLQASRSSVRKWKRRYEQFGEAGLVPERRGRRERTVDETVCAKVLEMIERKPSEYGYLRSRWTSEMLAEQLKRWAESIHASTVRRLLPRIGVVWNRARPTLCIRDPRKAKRMKAIEQALNSADEHNPVFYSDEADIDLNPRIGNGWMKKGQQTAIPTPGKNQKRYLAGALNAVTGTVTWVEWEKKNSEIFIRLLAELRRRYRQARTIRLIVDNYVIHNSAMTLCFLRHNRKFKLLFQPAYHPWVNRIERLWKKLHDTVTRNHQHGTMNRLMEAVRTFMALASPFPGDGMALAKVLVDRN